MYDVLIVGLGCAGYSSAIYAARYKLNTFIVGEMEGGLGMTAAEVGNWPGTVEIRGPDLMTSFKTHALSFENVTHRIARVQSIEKIEGGFRMALDSGETAEGKTLIFAMGSNKRHLGAPGEEELAGKGVTYCATCDAFFYRNKTVAVIGGGDAAVEGAAITAQVAAKVYLIHRRDDFRAEPYWVDKVRERDNVTFVLSRNVVSINGTDRVQSVTLDQPFEGQTQLPVDGVFIEIGALPATDLAQSIGCAVDAKGYLQVDRAQATSVQGVFGAGDITSGSNYFAQFATAAGEGAVAANSAFHYLSGGAGHDAP